jgi:hypothetical protein
MTRRISRRSLVNPLTRSSQRPPPAPSLPTQHQNDPITTTATTKIYKPSTPRHPDPSAVGSGPDGPSRVDLFKIHISKIIAACGGFVDQTSNYSFGTALTLLPHILGTG